MSPTLLELIVAIFLIWVSWNIGRWLAPRVFGPFITSWRNARPPTEPARWPPEKNITPAAERTKDSQSSHGNIPK